MVKKVIDGHIRYLLRPYEAQEVKGSIFSMHPDKSPGLDGLNLAFFQAYWDIVDQEVTTTCIKCLNDGHLIEEMNSTQIVLIIKKP